ncbi:cationic peroxidase 1-like, partial [Trifolium medium]|nr:cationic peroxidase 1-like [Trifolium medium]
AHTIGQVRCFFFRARIYNETNIDPTFAAEMQAACPFEGGDNNLSPFDSSTPTNFDNAFYDNLVKNKGLVHSDQQLFGNGSSTNAQVRTYSRNMGRFKKDFANAMFKMTLLTPLTGTDGEIRQNCRVINAPSNTTTTA